MVARTRRALKHALAVNLEVQPTTPGFLMPSPAPRANLAAGPQMQQATCGTSSTGWASMTRASLRCPGHIRLAGLSKSEAARSKRAMVSRTAALTRVPCQHPAPSDTTGKEELACRVGSRGHQNGSSLTTNTSSPPSMKRKMPICFGCHRTGAFTKMRASRNILCNTGMIRLLSSRISRRPTSNFQNKGQSLSLQVEFRSKSARRGHILSKGRADKQSSAATASTLEFSA
mmetsp:Transcript_67785/g.161771  ORF Transcript_67785/g.161771 Transcript_67785/m.161771 type:complete len:230 (+) Transcript_67785:615-1304(+)